VKVDAHRLLPKTLVCASLIAAAAFAALAAEPSIKGKPAADFALKAVSGENVRLSEHLGEVVMLNFWATWCGPCRLEMPRLDQLHATYHSAGLVLLGVNVDDNGERAVEFAQALSVSYPVLLDPRKAVAPLYDLDALPMTVLIDRAGTVRYVHHDYSPAIEKQYVAELRQLLDE
jgi:peroxiredoxin